MRVRTNRPSDIAAFLFCLLPQGIRCCSRGPRAAVAGVGLYGGKRELQRVAQGRRRAHFADMRTQLDQSSCHARRNARDDAIAAHQPGCLGDPDEIVGDRGVDGNDAANIHETRARLSEMRDSVFSMMSCVRCESTMPTSGSNRIPSQIEVTGVDMASIALPLSITRRFANCAI